jgi:hypothetical protein
MSKVAISIKHNNTEIISDFGEDSTKQEIEKLSDFLKSAVKGELTYLTFKSNNREYIFPKNVLINSIVSIVYL